MVGRRVVSGVPICPEGSLDCHHGLEVGLGNVSPWLGKEERWLRAEWHAQGLNYSMHGLDSIQRAQGGLARYQCVRKNMSPHLKALDPIPRGCWMCCVVWFVGWNVSPVATIRVDTLFRGRDRTSSKWLKSAGSGSGSSGFKS